MSNPIAFLQRKVDKTYVDLANLEAEKANLEVARDAGIHRPGAAARLTRLRGLIRGAKLQHGNAEKKLMDALTSQQNGLPPQTPHQQAVTQTSDAHGPQATINVGEGSEGSNLPVNLPSAVAASVNPLVQPAAPATPPTPVPVPSLSPDVSNVALGDDAPSGEILATAVDPTDETSLGPELTTPVDPQAMQAIPASSSLPISDPNSVSLKRLDHSETEDEDSGVKDIDMRLMSLDDRTKYKEISDDSDDKGDPRLFYEDDEEVGPAGNTDSPMADPPNPLSSANNSRESSAEVALSKGKVGQNVSEGRKRTVVAISKGKGLEKNLKDTKGISPLKDIRGAESEESDTDRGNTEDYHATDHSLAKAARKATHLEKQRGKLTNEVKQCTGNLFGTGLTLGTWKNLLRSPGIDLIRYDPDYLPDVATTDFHLTHELLMNNSAEPEARITRRQSRGPRPYLGNPLPRKQNRNIKSGITRTPGHFHCGCHEKVALAGFVMWKTWKARSMISGQMVVEGLHKHKPFSPREVLFILQFLKSMFGYTVEDMFTASSDMEEEARNEAEVMRKVANHCARRYYELIGQEMSLDIHFPVQEEELTPQWI